MVLNYRIKWLSDIGIVALTHRNGGSLFPEGWLRISGQVAQNIPESSLPE